MSSFSFTAGERRALGFLLVLLLLGSAVQLYHRYHPDASPTYTVAVDTLPTGSDYGWDDGPQMKLRRGIDPNLAPAEDLELLPGIGPVLARAIVADRERAGPFRSPDDLLRVTGIGAATLARIRPHLTLP